MPDQRYCVVCDAPIKEYRSRFVTCGHPRCMRENNMRRMKSTRVMPRWSAPDIYQPDNKGREKIKKVWQTTDGTNVERVVITSRLTGEPAGVVMETVRSLVLAGEL